MMAIAPPLPASKTTMSMLVESSYMALCCIVERLLFRACRSINNQIHVVISNIVQETIDMFISTFRWCP